MGNTILGANSPTGYDVTNSLRFNGANQYMHRTPSSTGSSLRATFSAWVKFNDTANEHALFGGWDDSGANDDDGYMVFYRAGGGRLVFKGGTDTYLQTNRLFLDTSAWYHIVLSIDSSQNSNNAQRLYVNGVEETSFYARSNLTNLQDLPMNTTAGNGDKILIGADEDTGGVGMYFDGYMADVFWIDNTQYAASNFGEYNDDNVWIPKKGTQIASDLTMGTNGFFLEFQQTGTSANSSGIGADTSGNDLHLTVAALGSNSPALDVPTNNFCTMIPADNMNLSNGNISGATTRTGNWDAVHGSIGVTTGKWYFECRASRTEDNFRVIVGVVGDPENWGIGFNGKGATGDPLSTFSNTYPFYGKGVWLSHWYDEDYNDSSTASTQSNNDIIQIALDMDNYKVWVGINGQFKDNSNNNVSYADVAAGNSATVSIASAAYTGKTFFPAFWLRDDQDQDDNLADINFGGSISFNISSAVADTAGRGRFEYTVPDGYYALCTKNLAAVG